MTPETERTYVIRKLTRHYFDEVHDFLRHTNLVNTESPDPDNLVITESPDPEILEKIYSREVDLKKGSIFFMSSQSENIRKKFSHGIFFLAYLDLQIQEGNSIPATMKNITYSPHMLRDQMFRNPDLLEQFFTLLERYASSRGKGKIVTPVTLRSSLLDYLAHNENYTIESHHLGKDTVTVQFSRDLLPDYRGDVLDFRVLSEWYLHLLRSRFTDVGELEDEWPHFTLKLGPDLADRDLLHKKLCEILVNAVCIDQDNIPDAKKIAEAAIDRQAFNLTILETVDGESETVRELSELSTVVTYRNLYENLKAVKGIYYKKKRCDKYWERFLELKVGANRKDRTGIIVEIDRDSYGAMVNKFKKNPEQEQFLFINQSGFAEHLPQACKIFFFVWDGKHRSRRHEKQDDHGVLCAVGKIDQVQKMSETELKSKWDTIKHLAIWEDYFAHQYFDDQIVCFYVNELLCFMHEPDLKTGGEEYPHFEGINYQDLLHILFESGETDQGSPGVVRSLFEVMPPWEVGNTYTDRRCTAELENKFTSLITEDDFKMFLSSTSNNHSAKSQEKESASYWVGRIESGQSINHRSAPCDIFLSFATADEDEKHFANICEIIFSRSLEVENLSMYGYLQREGIATGDDWRDEVAFQMTHCKAAILLLSPRYFHSSACYKFELPFLFWRKKTANVMLYPVRIQDFPENLQKVNFPDTKVGPDVGDLRGIVDDRINALRQDLARQTKFADKTLAELYEMGHKTQIDNRLTKLATEMIRQLAGNRSG